MATITGRVVNIVLGPPKEFSVGRPVVVSRDGTAVAAGHLDEADEFSIDVGDATGQLEITVGLHDVASVVLDFDGTDAHVELMHNGSHRI